MLSYSKGQAFVVFLKWMACFFVMNQIVAGAFAMGEILRLVAAGDEITFRGLMAVVSSPWIVVIGNSLAWALFMFWETKSTRLPWRAALAMRVNPVFWFVPVFLIGAGMIILLNEIDFRFSQVLPMSDYFKEMMGALGNLDESPVGAFLALVVVAPITEEILCRGILLRGMLNRLRPGTAIVLSALMFAIMHLNPWQAVTAFVIGLVLGWVYMRTRSLALCIFIHAFNNAVALYFMSMLGDGGELILENPWWLNVGGLVAAAAGFAWLAQVTGDGPPADEFAVAKPPPLPVAVASPAIAVPPPLPPS